jgi:predicted MPP superfamily phosphohydrolase
MFKYRRAFAFLSALVLLTLLGFGFSKIPVQPGVFLVQPMASTLPSNPPVKLPLPEVPIPEKTGAEKPLEKPFRFVAMGDTGSGLKGQYQLAAQLLASYQKAPYEFVFLLGDNIYPDGNITRDAQQKFYKPYQALLDKQLPFYALLGNHDVDFGHATEQMQFFKMPARYYTMVKGPVTFFVLDTNHFDSTQKKWLQNNLQDSPAEWKIVLGHHPVMSSGFHGGSHALIKDLKPLLEQYHVALYLCGHDHAYERFNPVNGVHYIVSGGGGASLRNFTHTLKETAFKKKTFEFLSIEIMGKVLSLEAIDASGATLDNLTLTHYSPSHN